MRTAVFNHEAPKKAANLSINSDLLRQAKALGMNLSMALEQKLEQMVRDEKEKRWKEENREAIEAYNNRIEEKGVFSDGKRAF
jgi:antitoxin CcdA